MIKSLDNQIKRQIRWSKKTFGPGYDHEGILKHMEQEIEEVRLDPSDLEEWIDLVILALDGAWRCASSKQDKESVEELLGVVASMHLHKQKKNENRVWPDWRTVKKGEAINHIKSDEFECPRCGAPHAPCGCKKNA